MYPEQLAASSPDDVDLEAFEQYPRINKIKYAKATDKIAKTKFYIVKIVADNKDSAPPVELNSVQDGLQFTIGNVGDQENRYFSRLGWAPDSSWFVMTWLSRAATQAKSMTPFFIGRKLRNHFFYQKFGNMEYFSVRKLIFTL